MKKQNQPIRPEDILLPGAVLVVGKLPEDAKHKERVAKTQALQRQSLQQRKLDYKQLEARVII